VKGKQQPFNCKISEYLQQKRNEQTTNKEQTKNKQQTTMVF